MNAWPKNDGVRVELLVEENMQLKEQIHLVKRENLGLRKQVDEAVAQLNMLYAERNGMLQEKK